MIARRIDLMALAEGLASGETLSGSEAKEMQELLNGPHYWELGVALALVYLNHGDEPRVEDATDALAQVLDRAYP